MSDSLNKIEVNMFNSFRNYVESRGAKETAHDQVLQDALQQVAVIFQQIRANCNNSQAPAPAPVAQPTYSQRAAQQSKNQLDFESGMKQKIRGYMSQHQIPYEKALIAAVNDETKKHGLFFMDVKNMIDKGSDLPPELQNLRPWMFNTTKPQNFGESVQGGDFIAAKEEEIKQIISNMYRNMTSINSRSIYDIVNKAMTSQQNAIQTTEQRDTVSYSLKRLAPIIYRNGLSLFGMTAGGNQMRNLGLSKQGDNADMLVQSLAHNRIVQVRSGRKIVNKSLDLASENDVESFIDSLIQSAM
jgi:hypothetical protein